MLPLSLGGLKAYDGGARAGLIHETKAICASGNGSERRQALLCCRTKAQWISCAPMEIPQRRGKPGDASREFPKTGFDLKPYRR